MINGKRHHSVEWPAFEMKVGKLESARTLDPDILRQFYLNPDIWGPMQCDDAQSAQDLDFEGIVTDNGEGSNIFVTTSRNGDLAALFMFTMMNSRCYSIHSALLPYYWGKGVAHLCGVSACTWMVNNTECLKVVTLVPYFNKTALSMALNAGMNIEGINRSSFMKDGVLYDQTMLGFTKEEILCQ